MCSKTISRPKEYWLVLKFFTVKWGSRVSAAKIRQADNAVSQRPRSSGRTALYIVVSACVRTVPQSPLFNNMRPSVTKAVSVEAQRSFSWRVLCARHTHTHTHTHLLIDPARTLSGAPYMFRQCAAAAAAAAGQCVFTFDWRLIRPHSCSSPVWTHVERERGTLETRTSVWRGSAGAVR